MKPKINKKFVDDLKFMRTRSWESDTLPSIPDFLEDFPQELDFEER